MELHNATRAGDAWSVSVILKESPYSINWTDALGQTALHQACTFDHSQILRLLLACPGVYVNWEDKYRWTPFSQACFCGSKECIKILLRDPRIDLATSNVWEGRTTLLDRAGGRLDIIQEWISSGKEIQQVGDMWTNHAKVNALLRRFEKDPKNTQHTVRNEIGWYDDRASEIFAPMVFLSDGLLQGRTPLTPVFSRSTSAARFFEIAEKLPVELQMVLCYRVAGSGKTLIPKKEIEIGLRELVWMLCLSE
jgi:ankyrin repeat protein